MNTTNIVGFRCLECHEFYKGWICIRAWLFLLLLLSPKSLSLSPRRQSYRLRLSYIYFTMPSVNPYFYFQCDVRKGSGSVGLFVNIFLSSYNIIYFSIALTQINYSYWLFILPIVNENKLFYSSLGILYLHSRSII